MRRRARSSRLNLRSTFAARPMARSHIPILSDEMASLTAYMAFNSRGKPFDIKVPNDPRALAAYENGKKYFYQRRGQLNFSCASCHVQSPASASAPKCWRRRSASSRPCRSTGRNGVGWEPPAAASSPATARFAACRCEPQDDLYRDVEYFLSYMSNGLPISGPGARP